jgi:hypothetical protein
MKRSANILSAPLAFILKTQAQYRSVFSHDPLSGGRGNFR